MINENKREEMGKIIKEFIHKSQCNIQYQGDLYIVKDAEETVVTFGYSEEEIFSFALGYLYSSKQDIQD